MKKILLITLFLLITNCIFSQTNHYPDSIGSHVYYENGYTYQVDRNAPLLIGIYNKDKNGLVLTKLTAPQVNTRQKTALFHLMPIIIRYN